MVFIYLLLLVGGWSGFLLPRSPTAGGMRCLVGTFQPPAQPQGRPGPWLFFPSWQQEGDVVENSPHHHQPHVDLENADGRRNWCRSPRRGKEAGGVGVPTDTFPHHRFAHAGVPGVLVLQSAQCVQSENHLSKTSVVFLTSHLLCSGQ